MSMNVRINKFRAHTAFAKGQIQNNDLQPKRISTPAEITSYSALFSVQKYCSKIEEIVQNMKRLCPIREMDQFFTAYAEYKNRISSIVDQSNMILRKLSPNFQNPTYHTGEDLRKYHEDFMTAVSHMKLQKQPIYFHAITELLNKLPLDLDKFLYKYRSNAQVKQFLATFENKFKDKLHKLEQDIRTILLPLEFEHLNYDKVYETVERLRGIHRMFEITLITSVKQRCPKDPNFPMPKDTDWHATVIQLVPILSNMPMFVENSNTLAQTIPDLTLAIEKLCLEIDELMPDDVGAFNETATPKKTVYQEDKVDVLLERVNNFLGIQTRKGQSKVDKLTEVVSKVEETINSLMNKLEEAKKENEKAKEDLDRSSIVRRFQRIRQASDDIAKKFSDDKDHFLTFVIDKLRTLIKFDFTLDEDDPYRMFNAIFKQLSKEMDQLRNNNGNYTDLSKDNNRNENDYQNDCKSSNSSYKEAFIKLCSSITHQNDDLDTKSPEELSSMIKKAFDDNDEMKLIDVDRLMQLIPTRYNRDNYLESLKEDLKKTEYTLEAVEPFNNVTNKLTTLLDQSESSYLPTSPDFSTYLNALAEMKDNLTKVKAEKMHKPIYSLLVKSTELFNSLAIGLSSASFAPEFSPNQKNIEKILTEQQNMNLSLSRLRILLEEKDSLLLAETRKLSKLEKQFSNILLENQKSNENIDPQKVIYKIETNESESDFF